MAWIIGRGFWSSGFSVSVYGSCLGNYCYLRAALFRLGIKDDDWDCGRC